MSKNKTFQFNNELRASRPLTNNQISRTRLTVLVDGVKVFFIELAPGVLTFSLVLLENKLQFNDLNNPHSIPFHFACYQRK